MSTIPPDPRIDRARTYLAAHAQPVSTLPPSALMRQLEDTRRHLAAVLAVLATGLDSESWACRGCGAPMIGHRPADDRCRECSPAEQGGMREPAEGTQL